MAVVAGGAGMALGMTPAVVATAAALAAVIRVLAGDSPAALTGAVLAPLVAVAAFAGADGEPIRAMIALAAAGDRKSPRLNYSHMSISYAVFCLKNKISQATEHISQLMH